MLKRTSIGAALFCLICGPVWAGEDVVPTPANQAPVEVAAVPTPAADDVPQAVKDACKGDYEKLCAKHPPESAEVRQCMAQAFEQLSDGCVAAILDSTLADQAQHAAAPESADVIPVAHRADESFAGQDGVKPAVRPARTHRMIQTTDAKPQPSHRLKARAAHGRSKQPKAKLAKRSLHVTPVSRTARLTPAPRNRADHMAQRPSRTKRSVAGYIKRGTSIANHYVAKYTRFAIAKALR